MADEVSTGLPQATFKPTPAIPDAIEDLQEVKMTPDEAKAVVEKEQASRGIKPKTDAPADATKTDRPAWLPEKFKSPEDLAKSYQELEKKLGQTAQQQQKAPEKAKPADTKPAEGDKATADKAQAEKAPETTPPPAAVDYQAMAQEFAQAGKLSDESYAKLQAAGMSKDLVDNYIEGQRAQAALYEQKIYDTVGGKDTLNSLFNWASQNLSEPEIGAVNEAIQSRDMGKVSFALNGLKARYEGAVGSEPQLLGGRSAAASGDVYESKEEMIRDMTDRRYRTDSAFVAKVQAKLSRSNILRG